MVQFLPPGGPLEYPSKTRSTAKEGAEDELKFPICSRFQPKLCLRSGTGNSLSTSKVTAATFVLRPLQQLLRVCALVQAGGKLDAFDPPKLYTSFNDRKGSITGGPPGFPNEDRELSASSGSGSAGGNSTRKDVLTAWVLGVTSLLKSLVDVSTNEDWRILATNHQHTSLSNSAK
jgi:hypothetical protein